MSYTMGTMMLTGSWGTGMRWVSCNCDPRHTKHTGVRSQAECRHACVVRVLQHYTYKEEHLGFKHHSDGPRRGDGGSAWGDGETELDIPFQLCSLIRELQGKVSL